MSASFSRKISVALWLPALVALATALGVLGPEEGYALAEREGLAAYFILREPGGGLRGVATPAFPPLERPQGSTEARAGG